MPDPDINTYIDSSTLGWSVTDGYNPSGGRWEAQERNHINVLELKAIFIGVQTHCHPFQKQPPFWVTPPSLNILIL